MTEWCGKDSCSPLPKSLVRSTNAERAIGAEVSRPLKEDGEENGQLDSPSLDSLVVEALDISTADEIVEFVVSNAKEWVSGKDSNGPEFPTCQEDM